MRIIALLLLLLINVSLINAQRCGDKLWFSLNYKGKPINPSDYQLIKITIKSLSITNSNNIVEEEIAPEILKLKDDLRVFSIRTICGLKEAKYQVTYDNRQMEITIKNIPGDAGNFIIKELEFTPGVFEIDLGNKAKQNYELAHDTIVSNSLIIEERLWLIKNANIIKQAQ